MELEQPRAGEVEPEPVVEQRAELAGGERLHADPHRAVEPQRRRAARAPARDQPPRRDVRESA